MTEMAHAPLRIFASAHARRVARILFRLALASGALLLCWRVAAGRFAEFDGASFWVHLSAISYGAIALAVVAAVVSYAAISCYDLIAFRALGARVPAGRLLQTGAVATALGQLFGFGLIIGALARWRLLRQNSVDQAMAAGASAIVTAGFLGGLFVLGGIAAAVWPTDIAAMTGASVGYVQVGGALIIAAFVGLLLAGQRRLSVRFFGQVITAPRPLMTLAQVALAVIDVFFAAAVLWLVTPAAANVALGTMFLAYIGVLAICLLANTPGGIGPLEGALLFALPHAPVEALLAGIVAFRALYYATPGLLALMIVADGETGGHLASLLRRNRGQDTAKSFRRVADDPALTRALGKSGRAEDELAHLGDKMFLSSPTSTAFLMYRVHGHALVAIGDPIGDDTETQVLCDRFLARAARNRLTPVFYKAGPKLAHAARMAGMNVGRLGREAVIDLATFTIADRDRREIRRKIRKSARAGVTIIAHAPGAAPIAAYGPLCAEWQATRKAPETSFSMGTCDPRYLSRFPIYEAQVGGVTVAFISLWRSGDGREWALDIMRHAADAPTGVMQALVVAACDGARASGASSFNLCLAPLSGLSSPLNLFERFGDLIYRRGDRLHRLQGLHRFKAAFRPSWHPRYVARARGLPGLYGLWAVYRLIHTPPEATELLATQTARAERSAADHESCKRNAMPPTPCTLDASLSAESEGQDRHDHEADFPRAIGL